MGRPPMTPEQLQASLVQRFHDGYEKGAADECWLWTGGAAKNGYGVLGTGKRGAKTVHRLALELAVGPAPSDDSFACHTCDVRLCVNPAHLYWGDILTNNSDIRSRGNKLTDTCRRGHVRTAQNTYVRVDGNGYTERHCEDCRRERQAARKTMTNSEAGRLGADARWGKEVAS